MLATYEEAERPRILPLGYLLEECHRLHVHMRPGQLLSAQMALLSRRLIGVGDPSGADRRQLWQVVTVPSIGVWRPLQERLIRGRRI